MAQRLIALLVAMLTAGPSHAHVKWFSTMANCVSKPLAPLRIFSAASFLGIYALAAFTMLLVFITDTKISLPVRAGRRYARPLPQLPPDSCALILRTGVAANFALISVYFWSSPITLTPELKVSSAWVSLLQLGVAVLALHRRSAWAAALGIVYLYAYSVSLYGWFHMLDYVFFLGMAAYLAMNGRARPNRALSGLAILRLTTGFSFLWVGIEKWSYPGWTYEILRFQLSGALMGFEPEFFIVAAGFVEFCLAFTLIAGRLSSRVAAGVLLTMLVLGMPLAGMVDVVGHFPLVIILLLLAGTNNTIGSVGGKKPDLPEVSGVSAPMLTATYCACVLGLTAAYYFAHELAYA